MSEDDFTVVLDTNPTGAYRLARRAVRGMPRLRRGKLIFICSVVGLLGSGGQANYAASKAGLVGLARPPGNSSRATSPPTWPARVVDSGMPMRGVRLQAEMPLLPQNMTTGQPVPHRSVGIR